MADVNVEAIFDDKEVQAFFKSLNTRLKKVEGSEKRYGGLLSAIVYRDVIKHFEEEQGQQGKWEDWSPSYEAQLGRLGRSGNKKLQFSGKLRQGFKPENFRKTGEGFLWFNNELTKSGFPYAAAHDEGGPKLPQREFMWLSGDAAEDISKQTLAFLLDEGI